MPVISPPKSHEPLTGGQASKLVVGWPETGEGARLRGLGELGAGIGQVPVVAENPLPLKWDSRSRRRGRKDAA
jgi:hypothetical protein